MTPPGLSKVSRQLVTAARANSTKQGTMGKRTVATQLGGKRSTVLSKTRTVAQLEKSLQKRQLSTPTQKDLKKAKSDFTETKQKISQHTKTFIEKQKTAIAMLQKRQTSTVKTLREEYRREVKTITTKLKPTIAKALTENSQLKALRQKLNNTSVFNISERRKIKKQIDTIESKQKTALLDKALAPIKDKWATKILLTQKQFGSQISKAQTAIEKKKSQSLEREERTTLQYRNRLDELDARETIIDKTQGDFTKTIAKVRADFQAQRKTIQEKQQQQRQDFESKQQPAAKKPLTSFFGRFKKLPDGPVSALQSRQQARADLKATHDVELAVLALSEELAIELIQMQYRSLKTASPGKATTKALAINEAKIKNLLQSIDKSLAKINQGIGKRGEALCGQVLQATDHYRKQVQHSINNPGAVSKEPPLKALWQAADELIASTTKEALDHRTVQEILGGDTQKRLATTENAIKKEVKAFEKRVEPSLKQKLETGIQIAKAGAKPTMQAVKFAVEARNLARGENASDSALTLADAKTAAQIAKHTASTLGKLHAISTQCKQSVNKAKFFFTVFLPGIRQVFKSYLATCSKIKQKANKGKISQKASVAGLDKAQKIFQEEIALYRKALRERP